MALILTARGLILNHASGLLKNVLTAKIVKSGPPRPHADCQANLRGNPDRHFVSPDLPQQTRNWGVCVGGEFHIIGI